jgi:hypothetical protein
MITTKQLFAAIEELNKAKRFEIGEHDHGGVVEVYWNMGDDEIAYGYFGNSQTIHVDFVRQGEHIKMTFQGERALALRHCGSCVSVETDSSGERMQA